MSIMGHDRYSKYTVMLKYDSKFFCGNCYTKWHKNIAVLVKKSNQRYYDIPNASVVHYVKNATLLGNGEVIDL